ncbi:hypothetical protein [Arenibacter certesii]|uniref:Uncharacterized protein n=1 Tax=Arenibacter certesii TaxID=228955 RepID=A0A918ISW4_9FLAO|nr:hypothetical protein [Arenibacter certesii]GGW27905.1 hypothetical protein GCM10007383_11740 [Arenibacter certesii]
MKNFRQLFYAGIIFMVANASLMAVNPGTRAMECGSNLETVTLTPYSFVGSWDYTVADVPYEYSTGVLFISKVKKEYVVKIKLQYNTIEATEVLLENDKMNFSVWIEGEKVAVTLALKDDKLIGKANASIGQMALTGKRSKA